jgi:hypothetical protein
MPISTWALFDYVTATGINDFARWTRSLDKRHQGKLASKLRMLENEGTKLVPGVLAGPLSGADNQARAIYKLKVRGNVQLRPMLCKGPYDQQHEFTLLIGAEETNRKLVPADAVERADNRRSEVANNMKRRCNHERIS